MSRGPNGPERPWGTYQGPQMSQCWKDVPGTMSAQLFCNTVPERRFYDHFLFLLFCYSTAICDSEAVLNRTRFRPWGGSQIESAEHSSSRSGRDVTLTERGRAVGGMDDAVLAQAIDHSQLCACALPFARCSLVARLEGRRSREFENNH